MQENINRILEKFLPFLTPLSVVVGVLLSTYLLPFTSLVPWILAIMTFSGAINSDFSSIKKALTNPLPILTALFCLHLLMPVWAWLVGYLTFANDSITITGFILSAVIPTGITSFIWVAMRHGNLALTLAIVLIDTLISPFVVPYSISLLIGNSIEMDVASIIKSLTLMIVLPSIMGLVINHVIKGTSKKQLVSWLSPASKMGIITVVMINCAEIAPSLKVINFKLIYIAFVVFFISFSGYFFSWMIAKLLKFREDEIIALIFTGGMRNIGVGIVIAVAFFPAGVAVPVVIGMLFQQLIASFYGYVISKIYKGNNQIELYKSSIK